MAINDIVLDKHRVTSLEVLGNASVLADLS